MSTHTTTPYDQMVALLQRPRRTPAEENALLQLIDEHPDELVRVALTPELSSEVRVEALVLTPDKGAETIGQAPDLFKALVNHLRRTSPSDAIDMLLRVLTESWYFQDREGAAIDLKALVVGLAQKSGYRQVLTDAQIRQAFEAFFVTWDETVNLELSRMLSKVSASDVKLRLLLEAISRTPTLIRATFDERCIAAALAAQGSERRLVQIILEQAATVPDDKLNVLGGLLVGVAGDQGAAGQLLNDLESQISLDSAILRKVRVAVGGAEALEPVFKELEETFAHPLEQARQDAHTQMTEAFKAARRGFTVRLVMSAGVFLLGAFVILWSVVRMTRPETTNALIGSGFTFAAGLGAVLAVTYKGPMDDVRDSFAYLAKATVGFVTYMHELHFTSSVWSADYAHGRLSPEALKVNEQTLAEVAAKALDIITQPLPDPKATAR